MAGHWCPTAQPPPASSALLVGLRDDDESGTVCAWRPPSRVTQEAVTGAHTQPDRFPSSTRAPKSFGRRDVNRCAKVLGVSVDFEATDWLALAHSSFCWCVFARGERTDFAMCALALLAHSRTVTEA